MRRPKTDQFFLCIRVRPPDPSRLLQPNLLSTALPGHACCNGTGDDSSNVVSVSVGVVGGEEAVTHVGGWWPVTESAKIGIIQKKIKDLCRILCVCVSRTRSLLPHKLLPHLAGV